MEEGILKGCRWNFEDFFLSLVCFYNKYILEVCHKIAKKKDFTPKTKDALLIYILQY